MTDAELRARIATLEDVAKELRARQDAQAKDNEEAHRRLWQELTNLAGEVIKVNTRQAENFRELSGDIGELKTSVETLGQWSSQARDDDRTWWEGKLTAMRGEQVEEQRATVSQKGLAIAVIGVVIAGLTFLVSTLISAGVFH